MRPIYPTTIQFRAPKEVAAQVAAAASERHQTISDYLRQLIVSDLRRRNSEQRHPNRSDKGSGLIAA